MSEFTPMPKIARLNRDILITEKIDGTNASVVIEQPEPYPQGCSDAEDKAWCAAVEAQQRNAVATVSTSSTDYVVLAGARNGYRQPGKGDHFGFAAFVQKNAEALVRALGPGRHFGEWWGAGIQRKYGLTEKRFSLFNVSKWGKVTANFDPTCLDLPDGVHLSFKGARVCACREARKAISLDLDGGSVRSVPVLYEGPWFVAEDDPTPAGGGAAGWGLYYGGVWAPSAALDQLRIRGSQAAPGFMRPEGIVVFHTASGALFKSTLEGDDKPKGAA